MEIPVEVSARAARDRNFLGKLIAEKKVWHREGEYERRHPEETRTFVADISRRARAQDPKPTVNLAIRPKKRKKR